ncbi:MAG: hypothetical protein R2830_05985 [Saprospiraceae bacterium]
MKTFISMLTLAVCCLFFNTAKAQGGYVLVDYMKVKPGMGDKYLECEKAWKTAIHQKRKQDGKILWWHLEQTMWPSGTSAEYDYLAVTYVPNWAAIGHLWDNWDAEQKALPADVKAIVDKTGQYRDIVKSEIWHDVDFAARPGFKEANYLVENFFLVPPGGWDDYVEMETRFVKPVHLKNIELGNRAGWELGRKVAPTGEDQPYNCSTVDLYDKWEDMDNDEGKAWETIYPGMSDAHIGHRINAARKHVRSEIRQVVYSTEK